MAGEYIPGQGGGSAQTPEQMVFWGYDNRPQYSLAEIDAGAPAGGGGRKQTKSATQAAGYLWQLAQTDPKQYEAYRSRMITAGVIGVDGTGADMQQAWMRALDASATAYAAGTMLTPWDAIDLLGQGYGDPNNPENFTGTKTQSVNSRSTTSDTNRAVDLSSASEARAFLLQAAEQQLGRAATKDEIAAFRAALNNEEKANAEVTKSTSTSVRTGTQSTTFEAGEATGSSDNTNTSSSSDTTRTGGMDRGQFAVDYARSADDYAEYQAATTYMNTLFAALASPTEVGTN